METYPKNAKELKVLATMLAVKKAPVLTEMTLGSTLSIATRLYDYMGGDCYKCCSVNMSEVLEGAMEAIKSLSENEELASMFHGVGIGGIGTNCAFQSASNEEKPVPEKVEDPAPSPDQEAAEEKKQKGKKS